MIGDRSVLAVITARGGSKGIPRKNIAEIAGRPLIAWTFQAAQRSRCIDRLILSSEDAEIIAIARAWGCDVPFVRPMELSRDDTPGPEPVLHAIEALPERYDFIVLLQPTSPLRSPEDIDGCIEKCAASGAPACVTVGLSHESPWWMYRMCDGDRLCPVMPGQTVERRQALPDTYSLNGAVYVAHTDWFLKRRTFITPETIGYVMPAERSHEIDTPLDLLIARVIMEKFGR